MHTLGNKLKNKRIEKGKFPKELAENIGVGISFICKVEKDEKRMSLNKLEKISTILDIDFTIIKVIYFIDKINSIIKD